MNLKIKIFSLQRKITQLWTLITVTKFKGKFSTVYSHLTANPNHNAYLQDTSSGLYWTGQYGQYDDWLRAGQKFNFRFSKVKQNKTKKAIMNSVTVGYGMTKAGWNKHLLGASFQICVACSGSDNRRSCQASYRKRSTAPSVPRSCNIIATSLNVRRFHPFIGHKGPYGV